MSSRKDVVVAFKIDGADQSKIEVGKVQKAMEDMGDAGKAAATPITQSFTNIQNAFDKVQQKLAEGKMLTARDVGAMAQQYAILQRHVEQAGKEIGDLPKELQEAMASAQSKVKATTAEFGRLNDTVKDNAAAAKIAGDQWPGLGNAIEAVGGKMGTAAGKAGLITAAFREGVSMGMEFNRWIGTDMSELEKLTADMGNRIGVVVRSAFDGMVIIGRTAVALMSGDLAEVKRSLSEMADHAEKHFGRMKDAVTMSASEFAAAYPTLAKHTEAVKENTTATTKNVAAQETVVDIQKRVIESQKQVIEQRDKMAEAIKAEEAALLKLTMAELDAEHGAIRRRSDMEYFERDVSRATTALNKQAAEVEELTARYGENDMRTRAAVEQQQALENSLRTASKQYETARDDVAKHTEEQRRAHEAVSAAKDKIAELTEQQKAQKATTEALTLQTTQFSTATKGASEGANALAGAVAKVEAPAKGTAAALEATAKHGPAAAAAISDVAASAAAAAGPAGAMAKALAPSDPAALLAFYRELNVQLRETRSAVEGIARAAAEAHRSMKALTDLAGEEEEAA